MWSAVAVFDGLNGRLALSCRVWSICAREASKLSAATRSRKIEIETETTANGATELKFWYLVLNLITGILRGRSAALI